MLLIAIAEDVDRLLVLGADLRRGDALLVRSVEFGAESAADVFALDFVLGLGQAERLADAVAHRGRALRGGVNGGAVAAVIDHHAMRFQR